MFCSVVASLRTEIAGARTASRVRIPGYILILVHCMYIQIPYIACTFKYHTLHVHSNTIHASVRHAYVYTNEKHGELM